MVGRDELQGTGYYLERENARDWIGVSNYSMELFCGANIGRQPRFGATHVNRKWAFWTLHPWFWTNSWQNVSLRVKTLSNTNLVASRYIRELKQRCFWATHVNRNWTFCTRQQRFWTNSWANCLFKSKTLSNTNLVTSRHEKCVAQKRCCLNSLLQEKNAHFRLTCITQKRCCLNTILTQFPTYSLCNKWKRHLNSPKCNSTHHRPSLTLNFNMAN